MIDLDTSDLQLLCALRDDSRLSLRDLGAKSQLSAPSVSARLKRLEQSGVIKGYTITICDSAFSLEVEALIYTKVRLERKDDYLDYMKKSLAVSSCMKIAGEYSYMAIASFKDIAHLNQFTECLEQNYGQCLVNIVLNKEFVNRPPMDVTSH
jgi:Lrp/AsnC family transcriptional regulator, leucine-responsive regulatory protein